MRRRGKKKRKEEVGNKMRGIQSTLFLSFLGCSNYGNFLGGVSFKILRIKKKKKVGLG